MDKEEYLRLLAEASIKDATKFRLVDPERQTSKGRPPKHYHPLLRKEKELEAIVRRILPTSVADSVRPSGSRQAHLYCLPKTHKKVSAMRPIFISYRVIQLRLGKMAWCKTQTTFHYSAHFVWHFRLLEWNPTAVNQQRWYTLGNFCLKSGQLCLGPYEAWVLIKTNSRWRREARRTTADYNGIEEAWKHQELQFQTNNWNEDM